MTKREAWTALNAAQKEIRNAPTTKAQAAAIEEAIRCLTYLKHLVTQ